MGLHEGVDFGVKMLEIVALDDPDDPRRGRDRVDQFLIPTLCKLGEEEFLCLIRPHKLGFPPSERMSGWLTTRSILNTIQRDSQKSGDEVLGLRSDTTR